MSIFKDAENLINSQNEKLNNIDIDVQNVKDDFKGVSQLAAQNFHDISELKKDLTNFTASNSAALNLVTPQDNLQSACDEAFASWLKERERILNLPGLDGIHKLAAANQSTITIFLAPGRHVINGTLIVQGGVKIIGLGRVILDFPNCKKGKDLPEKHKVNYGPFCENKVAILFDTDAEDSKTFASPGESGIEGCEIQAGSAFGIAVQGTRNNFNVRKCKLKGYPQLNDDAGDFMKGGIAFLPKFDYFWENGKPWNPSSASWQTDTHIEDCLFESVEMGIVGSCGEQPHIQRNQFNSVRHACVLWSIVQGVIRDNTVFMVPKYSKGERTPEEAFLINAAHVPTFCGNNWVVGHPLPHTVGDGYNNGMVVDEDGIVAHKSFSYIIRKAWK